MDDYVDFINRTLKPKIKHKERVLDLFAGAGGLALGFESSGFETIGIEMDKDCCDTYNKNLHGECIQEMIDENTDFPEAEIIIGGPPCQPFSVGGNQKGHNDTRNGFPGYIAAVKKIRPKIFLIENVRGMLYKNKDYLLKVVDELTDLGYVVDYQLFNTVEFQVPQTRQRVVIVGHDGSYHYPTPLSHKITAGQALQELATQTPPESRFLTPNMDVYIKKYEDKSACVNPRDLHLDRPARTLTCRNLAGATGDMHRVRLPDGRRRRILHREAARLQSFPDHYEFIGNETSVYNQIGNAVPPMFAKHLADSVANYLTLKPSRSRMTQAKLITI